MILGHRQRIHDEVSASKNEIWLGPLALGMFQTLRHPLGRPVRRLHMDIGKVGHSKRAFPQGRWSGRRKGWKKGATGGSGKYFTSRKISL